MIPEWQPRAHLSDESVLPAHLKLPPLVARFLSARGYRESSELESFLQPSMKSLTNPYVLAGMTEAVDRLLKAYFDNETLAIYADFDLDGTSGLALFYQGLKSLGYKKLVPYQPKRLQEGYGIHASAVESLAKEGVSLITSIDVGITAVEAVERANNLGVDVIITDHHLPGAKLPSAFSIINPNIGSCPSGLGHLCGAGVAFYLLWALRIRFAKEGILPKDFDLKSVLDCYAIGTLTDMVPLINENRVLVKHGLKVLEQTQRPGLKHLLDKLGMYQRPLSSQDVAIRFAPKLNALSRLELGLRPIDIFLEEDEEKAKSLVDEVIQSNELRLKLQKEAEGEAVERLLNWDNDHFVFVASKNFHQGVVGLVATKLAQNFGCPAFVGSISEEGSVTGSARLPKDSPLCLVEALGNAGEHFIKYGGHSAAAGFELNEASLPKVIEALSHYYSSTEKEKSKAMPVVFDVDASLGELDEPTMAWIDHLGPFGAQFEVPIFRLPNVRIESVSTLRGGHLKLKLYEDATARFADAIWFFPPKPEVLSAQGFKEGARVSILCEVQWNYFAGRKSIQILVQDCRCL